MTEIQRKLAELNGMQAEVYAQEVSRLFRKKYTQNAVEAIINNYLLDTTDERYMAEFLEMQEYRASCKAEARAEIYGE